MITAIFRTPAWSRGRRGDASVIAAELMEPAGLRRMSLLELFQGVLAAGADIWEFRALWRYEEFVRRVERALQDGDGDALDALIATIPVDLSPATMQAVHEVIKANTLRLIDVVWSETDEEGNPLPDPPREVTPEVVEKTLVDAGFRWNGKQWVRRKRDPRPV